MVTKISVSSAVVFNVVSPQARMRRPPAIMPELNRSSQHDSVASMRSSGGVVIRRGFAISPPSVTVSNCKWATATQSLALFVRNETQTGAFGVDCCGTRKMQLPERYRCYAVDCVHVAQTANTTKDKALLLRMTETWNRLAEQAASKEQESDP